MYIYIYIYIYIEQLWLSIKQVILGGVSDSYAVPSGVDQPLFPGSVNLILPTGIIQQKFDTLSTALKCIHCMEQQKLYSLSPNEDVTIINLRSELFIF